jgi:Cysteine sulfinate desulfinase/cysteine desulfurase and related enzymes
LASENIAMQHEIYLDNNATTLLSLGVRAKLIDAINNPFGNASSEHQSGESARKEISEARSQIAELLMLNLAKFISAVV